MQKPIRINGVGQEVRGVQIWTLENRRVTIDFAHTGELAPKQAYSCCTTLKTPEVGAPGASQSEGEMIDLIILLIPFNLPE